jgi:hypothetical protein
MKSQRMRRGPVEEAIPHARPATDVTVLDV